mgnify:CR=1 FL=1
MHARGKAGTGGGFRIFCQCTCALGMCEPKTMFACISNISITKGQLHAACIMRVQPAAADDKHKKKILGEDSNARRLAPGRIQDGRLICNEV